ncbi:non-ribosomal peptide synthase domain TIGR01720/amino acid adenylation domain-containing protein [Chitinophaga eiseniae]|uniref:Non-ribosomal peptide synthase domain TIGR01720/amino acid adenylation domain-containing protein n=1 Tax=Chitinophaga eiseniae TaxID=634771 RepID=A0A1T4TC55_9BACT|nr:non-ribosomal peptide synthetase [Chitinophaga eiseniae]SKA37911.1 non-ribosomal peptide synthase domain TIGR01720/amino acid adenylation domain-containing protein [Chitinophaga eiseniae]
MSDFNLIDIVDLLGRAQDSGIKISYDENDLVVKVNKEQKIDSSLLKVLKDNKQHLITYFRQYHQRTAAVTGSAITAASGRSADTATPLSFSQERLWIIDQLEGSVQYHLSAALRMEGPLDRGALENALREIVNRHEVLRTVIRTSEDGGRPSQYVMEKDQWRLRIREDAEVFHDTAALQEVLRQDIAIPFDLANDHLLRAQLIVLGKEEHILVLTLHHIVSDGWSTGILVSELQALYDAYANGYTPDLAPLEIQYADYALWQRRQLGDNGLQQQLEYWKQQLAGVAPLELPLDYPRPAVQSTRGATIDFVVDDNIAHKLKQLSRQEDVTLFMTLLAAFKVLLYRYSGQEDICVGSPVSGRTRAEMETLIGLFVNTLALRSDLGGHPSFRALLQQIKQTTLSAYDHQEIPLEKVIETVVKGRNPGRSPLFQVVFALQNTPVSKAEAPGKLRLSEEKIITESAKFDLTLIMQEIDGGLKGSVEYGADLFSAATIEALIGHFKELLQSVTTTPDARIDDLLLLNKAEEQQLQLTFNDTYTDFPTDKTVLDLFREQVITRPDTVAVKSADGALSYQALEERSNRLAHYLQQQGVTAGSLVPICLERSHDLVVAMLAVIKTGAAYVPVDPSYPAARIGFMLEDTGAAIVICNEVITVGIGEKIRPVVPEREQASIDRCPATALSVTPAADQLVYVIYTSGSTGQPKGVMIEHRGLANLVHWHQRAFGVTADSRATAVSGIGFDAFGWELWPYLTAGASVFLVDDDTRIFIPALVGLHVKQQITHAFISTALVPAFIQAGAGKIQDLQYLLTGGDKLPATQVSQLPYQLVNNYGPTENSVVTTSYTLSSVNAVMTPPIGSPVSNTRIYILSPAGALSPVGVAGEICIAGTGLAKGYLNLPVLTTEKFTIHTNGERIYHTGDLGRWRADGTIEYLGRIDEQVKIRGYRIEPGEIENVLAAVKGAKQALVLAKADSAGHKRLVAYVAGDESFDKAAALAAVKSRLPEYMVPAAIIVMDRLPLTANGKIDKNALPEPAQESTATAIYTAPRNTTEEVLAAIWQELLGVQQVGIYDNFFELGGDSIITIQAVGRIRRAGYELQPRDLFVHQHIAALAAHIHAQAGRSVTGEQGTLTGTSGLLPIQQWFLQLDTAAVNHFNQSVLLGIDKKITAERLMPAIQQLVNYHDALRFVYHQQENKWQQVYGAGGGELEIADLRSVPTEALSDAITATADRYQASLDIRTGTVAKVVLIQTPDAEEANRLFIVVHHLAVDAVSWRILLEDLQQLLQGQSLPERKGSSYRQWQQALVNYGESQRGLSQAPYWERVVQQPLPLKTDKKFEGQVTVADTGNYTSQLDAQRTRQLLKDASQAYHTEINDILLTALALTLSAWNGHAAVIVGLEGHGREDINKNIDTSRTVGWFTNLFPVLLETGGNNVGETLKAVKEQLRRTPDKGLGYGVLKYLNKIPTLQGVNPWNVVFNYLGQSDNLKDEAGLFSGAPESSGADIAAGFPLQELLSVTGLVKAGQLQLDWNYSSQHFEPATIAQLAQHYLSHLEALIAHCVAVQTPVFTPSDYGLGAWVSNEDLDSFLDAPYNGTPRREQIDSLYRLSGLQEGMLFHSLYAAEGGTYTEQMTVVLEDLHVDAFVKSWNLLVEKHSILRTAFYYDRFSIPVQCVYKKVVLPVEIMDYTSFSPDEQNRLYKTLEEADLRRGFNFTEAPLMRLTLVRLHDNNFRMLWTSHHILLDGWSLPILVEGLLSGYDAFLTGGAPPSLGDDRFGEYIQYLDRLDKEAAEHYWKQYLHNLNEATLLPFIGNTTARTKGVGAYSNRKVVLDAAFTQQLSRFAQRHHITVNTLMQGVWAYLLHAYTGHSNVAYGITVSGRPDNLQSAERGVGLYINTLPLHTAVDESDNIVSWLQQLQSEQQQSREHQYNNLQQVQQWAGINGDLFDSSITFQNYPVDEVVNAKEWQLKVTGVETHPHTNYPLTIIISISAETSLMFAYNTALLEDHYLEAITGHFKQVLQQITAGTAEIVGDIELLTPTEKQRLLNTATVAYPAHTTLLDIFEEQADRVPEQTAVRCEDRVLTYHQLDKQATQLAHYLRSKGVTTGSLVPLYFERSADILIALLGILKAGGAYVPIDPDFPAERVGYMLADTAAKVIVTNKACAGKLPLTDQHIIALDGDAALLDTMPATRITREWLHGQPAYVIYTSGSTGNPKGVIVTHQNLMDYVYGLKHALPLEESRSFGLMSSIATDLGNTVVFGALATGGALHVFTKEAVNDAERIAAYFAAHPVDCIKIVPSHWKALSLPGNLLLPRKLLIFGGEALDAGVIAAIRASGNNVTVVNHYGPTETTIGKLVHVVQPDRLYEEQVPVGKPFSNTRIYVVSPTGKLSPVGVPGELYIGGDGVAARYLHQEALTSEKFVADRFLPGVASRLYRTGDLVKYLPDGNILFLGRADDQVKIRGYRVELGEIENVLVKSGLTEQAVVLAKPDSSGDKRLVAYILRGNGTDIEALQAYVKNELPDHMHPALWSFIDSFPLMANGKVDRKALPDPEEASGEQKGYAAPETSVEQKLAAIWSVLLEVEEVGRHDDFFALGGHSLLAIRLISAIRKQMEAEVTIGDVFDYPTVAALAAQLEQRKPQPPAPALVPKERPARIPLSFSQERLWFIDRMEGSIHYHVPAVLSLKGKLDSTALATALKTIVERHEVLRTVIEHEEGLAWQRILPADDWQLQIIAGTSLITEPALQDYISRLINAPFDLGNDYMLRAHLIVRQQDEYVLVVTLHHIASDAWSTGIIVEELAALYDAYATGRTPSLPERNIQYADFAVWQREYLAGSVLEDKLGYWKNKLSGTATLQLPTDFPRPAVQSTRGSLYSFRLDRNLSAALQTLSQQQGATLFMTLLAAFKVLLYRYSGQEDICVGVPTAGRTLQETEGLIGFFINTLALRSDLANEPSFITLLQQVKQTTLGAYQQQDVPFEQVVDAVVRERDISRTPLFQVMFVLQNAPQEATLTLGDLRLSQQENAHATSRFDLSWSVIEGAEGLMGSVEYCTDLFREATIQRMVGHFEQLLRTIVQTPDAVIDELTLITPQETTQLLHTFNQTTAAYPAEDTLLSLFASQVTMRPNSIALASATASLTYKTLNERAVQLAHYLQGLGVKAGDRVPVYLERTPEIVLAMLAVMKAGAAYVPVDTAYPSDRVRYMLADCGAAALITDSHHVNSVPDIDQLTVIRLDEDKGAINHYVPVADLPEVAPGQVAYLIYTSGSTGQPKGVMIPHRGLMNLVHWHQAAFRVNAHSKATAVSGVGFDAFGWEVWPYLTAGAYVYLPDNDTRVLMPSLIALHRQQGFTHAFISTAQVQEFIRAAADKILPLQYLLTGGDQLPATDVSGLSYKIINNYGPTENSVVATWYELSATDKDRAPVIGRPVSNTRIYILNRREKLCPAGIAGEICLAGDSLALGYWGRPDLTQEKFVSDPFHAGTLMYKTGDLGRWLPDGTIEYLGRLDEQVKVRGYRIELGEIESALTASGRVQQAVVLAQKDHEGNRQLVAYVVPAGDFQKTDTVAFLKKRLPDYMLPALWVTLDKLPLTANGKIDKSALPAPDMTNILTNVYVAPRSATEETLAGIWQEVLGRQQIGIHDNFFECGGNSLQVVRLIALVRSQLQVEMPIRAVFANPTVAQLAVWLATAEGKPAAAISVQARGPRIPLSFSQERLWFIHQLEGSIQYHIPQLLQLHGDLNIPALERSFQTLVNRHEVLRSVMKEEDGVVYQQVLPADTWSLEVIDNVDGYMEGGSRETYLGVLVRTPFDLSHDHPIRAHLLRLGHHQHLLVLVIHHIAADGWSMGVATRELMALYNAYAGGEALQLPELPLQYADFAIWQRAQLSADALDRKLGWWKNKMDGVAPLELPTDFTPSSTISMRGARVGMQLPASLGRQLHQLALQQDATLYMVLLTAFKVLLHRYSGQDDISVGTSAAGRTQQETQHLIGFFINTLALRSDLGNNPAFTELLQQVKQTTLDAFDHQDVPFEKIVEAVVKDRDPNRRPLFQVMFVMDNTPASPDFKLHGLALMPEEITHTTARFNIILSITEDSDGGLHAAVEYAMDLFREETILRMLGHFETLLEAIVAAPQEKVDLLPLMTGKQQQEQLAILEQTIHYPRQQTFLHWFEAVARHNPDGTALAFEGQLLSWKALEQRSALLAHYLRSKGVGANVLVPVCIDRSLDMLVAVLGILRAGGAYVPVEPDFPAERIKYMLEDTRATVMVSIGKHRDILPDIQGLEIIFQDEQQHIFNAYTTTGRLELPAPSATAYVIYTSGSTGKPKGVKITHHNLADYIAGLRAQLPVDACHSFGLLSSIATDLGNTVLFAALSIGATLHLFSKDTINDAQKVLAYFERHEIDCIKIVPSHWKALSEPGQPLLPEKLLIFGGEALEYSVTETIRAAGASCVVVNHYGPTETTIGKLLHIVNAHTEYGAFIPVGKPFSNTRAYVLNPQRQLCPVGVPGELYIGGEGVAAGYLHNETLTAERFVSEPLAAGPAERLYRTGDRVKLLPDGNILFLGRIDDQVKIRGYRVEPGEIGRILEQCPGVAQAVVIAREDNTGNKRLLGYVVPADDFDATEVFTLLRERLPDYMVPAAIIPLETFPLLANGKIDKRSLPDTETITTDTHDFAAPVTAIQQGLATIWERLLEVENVGLHDDFFALGGHSLLAIRVISAIRKQLQLEVTIGDVFDYPTVGGLAALLESREGHSQPPDLLRKERPARIPLSFSQERLWFIDQVEGSLHYHLPTVLRLRGRLDAEALARSAQAIVNRHEALRTVIASGDGESWQQILPENQWRMDTYEDPSFRKDKNALHAFVEELITKPFDLSADHMLRMQLIVLGKEEHVLVATLHHIASDGWSTGVLVKELAAFYEAYAGGREPELAPLELQYADYAIWQREHLSGEVLAGQLGYWEQKLSGVAALQLPLDHPRTALQSNRGATTTFILDRELSDQLHVLAKQEGATIFMTLLAAFQVLLYRYSGQEDICVGSPVAGRTRQELEGLIGFFINTLSLRADLSGNPSFTSLLQQVKQTTLDAYAHQEVPFEKIVDVVAKDRDLSRNPIFQVALVLQNLPDVPELELGDLVMTEEGGEHTTAKLDLTVLFREGPEGLGASVEYCADLFDADTIERMMSQFKQLLQAIVDAPGTPVGMLPLLTAADEKMLLEDFNHTAVPYPADKTIVQLFTEQARQRPNETAVLFRDQVLTYRQLDEWSDRLAIYLRSQGVKEEMRVPVCIPRSLEMMAAILAILKAGGAYVPLDPDYPAERLAFMLSESNSHITVTVHTYAAILAKERPDMLHLCVDELYDSLPAYTGAVIPDTLKAGSLAYVMYTSGSTGRPKGVLVTHRNVTSLVKEPNYVSLRPTDAILSAGSLSFDATTFEYWGALLNGGRLVLSPENSLLDTEVLKQELYEKQVTVLFITTGWFNQLVDTDVSVFAHLQAILTGGEKMSEKHVIRFRDAYPDIKISNIYGPTENTTFSLSYPIHERGLTVNTPIGIPLNNRTAYILDAALQLVPVGVAGELYVGGDGVARGYLNRDELTAERFIPHPYGKTPGDRLYKTGDMARWRADGTVEYLGRRDDQVKVRGFRIELGEVESVLLQHPQVSQTVVIAKAGENGSKRLLGYIVPKGGLEREQLATWLKERLPDYMVPSYLVQLEKLPMTANGKIDKKALPDPDTMTQPGGGYVAPATPTERALAAIWQDQLEIARIGVHDNYFEAGGNSLLAIHLIAVVRKELAGEIAISDIFDFPTIAALADVLDQRAMAKVNTAGQVKGYNGNRHILPLNSGPQASPLFFLPGGNGICEGYTTLGAALEDTGALYGLQMMGIFEGEKPLDSVPAIATQNIVWMRSVQPTGPYRLIGHSLGGQIAFEMARQLEAQGDKVEALFVLDTHVAPKRTVLDNDTLYHSLLEAFDVYKIAVKPYPEWVKALKPAIEGLEPREVIPFVLEYLKAHVPGEKEHLGFVMRMFDMATHSLFMEYVVSGQVDTALTVIRAEERKVTNGDDSLGWASFATRSASLTAPGDHISMTKETGAATVADHIKTQLNHIF